MTERIRTIIIILLFAVGWYVFIGRKVDEPVRRYRTTVTTGSQSQDEAPEADPITESLP